MEKKFVLDCLYDLRSFFIKEMNSKYQKSIDKKDDVCLNNLLIGESRGYETAYAELNKVIEMVINKD